MLGALKWRPRTIHNHIFGLEYVLKSHLPTVSLDYPFPDRHRSAQRLFPCVLSTASLVTVQSPRTPLSRSKFVSFLPDPVNFSAANYLCAHQTGVVSRFFFFLLPLLLQRQQQSPAINISTAESENSHCHTPQTVVCVARRTLGSLFFCNFFVFNFIRTTITINGSVWSLLFAFCLLYRRRRRRRRWAWITAQFHFLNHSQNEQKMCFIWWSGFLISHFVD